MRSKCAAKPRQIERRVDLPHQIIFGNRIAEMKLVEQLTLVTLQTAHHGSTSSRFALTQRNHACRLVSTDFCNKIGAKRPFNEAVRSVKCHYRPCCLNSPGVILVARRKARVKLAYEEKPERNAISLKGNRPAPIIFFAASRRRWLT